MEGAGQRAYTGSESEIIVTRYFFNLHECGTVLDDEEGRELPNLAAARDRAILEARELMSAEVSQGRLCLSCSIVIQDGGREALLTVPFRDALVLTGL